MKESVFWVALLLVVIGLLSCLDHDYRDQCNDLMALAKNRADSLQVYAATPGKYSGTCLRVLRD